jgi:hypothetical protein
VAVRIEKNYVEIKGKKNSPPPPVEVVFWLCCGAGSATLCGSGSCRETKKKLLCGMVFVSGFSRGRREKNNGLRLVQIILEAPILQNHMNRK